jgi:hypothetical protein
MLLRSGTIINNDKDHVIKSDKCVLLDAWVLNYICYKCSNSGYNFVNDQINIDINNNIIPPIYKRYNFRYNNDRKNTIVQILRYLIDVVDTSNEDYSTIICSDCRQRCVSEKRNLVELSRKLIKSIYITLIFDNMSGDYLEYSTHLFKQHKKFETVVKYKLISFRNLSELCPINYYWKGAECYYKQIFGSSSVLDTIIPIDIYTLRNNIFLNDSICGHPMASHGWYQESLQNINDMDAFIN